MSKTIGIDLGTTFSAMAMVDDNGEAQIIVNREGERITPSVVLFDEDGPVVGTIAKSNAADMPLSVCQFVKRRMGERTTAFRSEDGEKFSPEEISALILKRLKEDAEEVLGEPVSRAVITVPAYFNDAQRKATEDAGKIAGLEVAAVINEPTAAALAYGVGQDKNGEVALVYDLGGGTFDVTILRVSDKLVEVIATNGDKNLGGFDWDNALINMIAEKAFGDSAAEALQDPALAQTLREKAEIAKKTLSGRETTTVRFASGTDKHRIDVTREEFEAATSSLIKRAERLLEAMLEDADMQWSGIDKILLVGGSSRMPAVSANLLKLSSMQPSKELHPDEVVAVGASYFAAQLSQSPDTKEITLIQDVCSHSLGIVIQDSTGRKMINSIVLRKDSQIPCEAKDVFSTVQDNQTALQVQVTQGEDSDLKYVHILGESHMNIPAYPKGAPLEVAFRYDENALVHVSVHDLTSGQPLGEMTIERKANLSGDEVSALAAKVTGISVN